MKLFDLWRQKNQTERQAKWTQYRTLLQRGDDPKAGDEAKLAALVAELGISEERVKEHAEAMAKHGPLRQRGDQLLKIEERMYAAERAATEHQEATDAIINRRREEARVLTEAFNVVQGEHRVAAEAAYQAEGLETEYPELFGNH